MTALTTTPTTRSAARPTSAPGWRLGALYGPAVYGVSAAAVALPDTAGHLHVGGPALAWILTAYAAGIGVGAVTAGRLIDLWCSRPILLIAATLLTCGTLACSLAPTLAAAVTGRVLLAVGSGAITATALAGTARLPDARRPAALAAFGACLAGFSATAPLAGAAATHWTWRAALVLPVLSIVVIPLCWPLTACLPRRARADWLGAGLLAAVAAGLLLTAQTAAQQASVLTIASVAAITTVAALGLAARTRARRDGFLPRGILSAAWFRRAAAAGAGVYAGLFAVLHAAPHLLTRQGYSTTEIGVLLLPGAVIAAVLARVAGRVARRVPARHVLAAASLLLAVALCYTALDPQPSAVAVATTAAFTASAVAQTLLTAEITTRAAADARGGAIGLLTLTIFLGGGCGTALCAALWQPWGPTAALVTAAILPAAAAAAARRLRTDA
ncbi:MFS transporter [Micromonospora sp. NPDC048830]|uniref:MFS transporter n=1 Tax=Micromonospora sp. NPDC048830 TaxID=3364257 RepID=UPI0037204C87